MQKMLIAYFFQVTIESGTERLIDIVKTGVTAEKRKEELSEENRNEPKITTELT